MWYQSSGLLTVRLCWSISSRSVDWRSLIGGSCADWFAWRRSCIEAADCCCVCVDWFPVRSICVEAARRFKEGRRTCCRFAIYCSYSTANLDYVLVQIGSGIERQDRIVFIQKRIGGDHVLGKDFPRFSWLFFLPLFQIRNKKLEAISDQKQKRKGIISYLFVPETTKLL